MARLLLRLDGTFRAGARAALVALVAAGLALGFAAHGGAGDGSGGGGRHLAPISQSRIEADLPATPPRSGSRLSPVAALPGLPAGRAPAPRAQPEATPERLATPTVTPTPTATPAPSATPVPAPAVPVSTPAPPQPTPAGTTFDSAG